MSEHHLPSDANLSHVRMMLEGLMDDARDYYAAESKRYTVTNKPKHRAKAMYYYGQMWLMSELIEKIHAIATKNNQAELYIELQHPRNI
jgi:hypothetical protein